MDILNKANYANYDTSKVPSAARAVRYSTKTLHSNIFQASSSFLQVNVKIIIAYKNSN